MKIHDRNFEKLLSQNYTPKKITANTERFGGQIEQLARQIAETKKSARPLPEQTGEKVEQKAKARPTPQAVASNEPAATVDVGNTGAAQQTQSVTAPEKKSDMLSLAARYVAAYEKNSGTDLSDEDEQARIAEVARFYSEPSRAGRLQTLVDAIG